MIVFNNLRDLCNLVDLFSCFAKQDKDPIHKILSENPFNLGNIVPDFGYLRSIPNLDTISLVLKKDFTRSL